MGQNLALNFHNHGYSVIVYNRTTEKTKNFVTKNPEISGSTTLKEFIGNLSRPRRIMLMVTAGTAVDATLNDLDKFLTKGDIIIEGGNSFFQDTERRYSKLSEKGVYYMGVGVSGGEEGALKGPCIMAGGPPECYEKVSKMLTDVAAKAEGACCQLLGPRGAGHYVKMVHNGIEYAIMQVMAEAYDLLTRGAGFDIKQVHDVFAEWNNAELNSFLMEIATQVLEHVDQETKKPLLSLILDSAKQKGTGKWTSQNSMDLGIPTPTIDTAVAARNLSAFKTERTAASKPYESQKRPEKTGRGFVDELRSAVHASMIISYAQGFHLLRAASCEYAYGLPFEEIARIWKGGCIIRSKLLDSIKQAYTKNEALANLIVDPETVKTILRLEPNWREAVKTAKDRAIPIPAINASLDYFDGYKSGRLPANFIQALRDYFGAHEYERIDRQGHFHTNWTN